MDHPFWSTTTWKLSLLLHWCLWWLSSPATLWPQGIWVSGAQSIVGIPCSPARWVLSGLSTHSLCRSQQAPNILPTSVHGPPQTGPSQGIVSSRRTTSLDRMDIKTATGLSIVMVSQLVRILKNILPSTLSREMVWNYVMFFTFSYLGIHIPSALFHCMANPPPP